MVYENDLVDAGSRVRLEELMQRYGIVAEPADFLSRVQRYYQLVCSLRYPPATGPHAIRGADGTALEAALGAALAHLVRPIEVLVVGSGHGFCGRVADDTRQFVKRLMPARELKRIDAIAVSQRDLRCGWLSQRPPGGPYDVIMTDALVHHASQPSRLFDLLAPELRDGGAYIMAHEPNARFWRNPACVAALASRRSARKATPADLLRTPLRAAASVLRRLGLRRDRSILGDVKLLLKRHYGLQRELSTSEVVRLIDIHRRTELTPGFSAGWDGFDWEQLQSTCLNQFRLEWTQTYYHTGAEVRPGDALHAADEKLRAEFPSDGFTFCAVWRKRK